MSRAELILKISSIKGVGHKTCLRILSALPKGIESEDQLRTALVQVAGQIPRFSPTNEGLELAFEKAHNIIFGAEREKVHVLAIGDNDYPVVLTQSESPPLILFCKGELAVLHSKSCAIIGSRGASSHAIRITQRVATKAVEAGLTVVSGLALGVDQAAHEGCLRAQGTTVAVLGGGLDKIHPKTNAALAEEIIDKGGLLVSEYPNGTIPIPSNFVKRNRIQAGLSGGVLLIQAAAKSGSMITCRHALDEGRCLGVYSPQEEDGTAYGGNAVMQSESESILISDSQSLKRFFRESSGRYEELQRTGQASRAHSGEQTRLDF